MDIHKPKPWRGVREFLKEYAIIVVGVLTALGAEQAVEWLHWRRLAVETEADLAAGLKVDLGNAVQWIAAAPCNVADNAQLTQALSSDAPRWRAIPSRYDSTPPIVLIQPGPLWSHDAWETALSSGALSHMPRERVAHYGIAYREVDLIRNWQVQSLAMIDQLSALGFDGSFSSQERHGYLNTLSGIAHLQHTIAANNRRLFGQASALGLGLTQAEVDARVAGDRKRLGACVTDVKLPIR